METQNKELYADIFTSVKKVFSPKPDDAFADIINSKNRSWLIILGIYVLLSALALMLILSGQIMGAVRSLLSTALLREFLYDMGGRNVINQMLRKIMPYGGLFGTGLLLGLVSFAVLSGCVKLFCLVKKLDLCFITVMNIVSVSLIIYIAAMFAGIIFGFFFVQFSIILIVAVAIGSLIMLYYGIQKIMPSDSSPFWSFLIINAVHIIVIALIGVGLFSAVLSGAIENMGGVIEDMFWDSYW